MLPVRETKKDIISLRNLKSFQTVKVSPDVVVQGSGLKTQQTGCFCVSMSVVQAGICGMKSTCVTSVLVKTQKDGDEIRQRQIKHHDLINDFPVEVSVI